MTDRQKEGCARDYTEPARASDLDLKEDMTTQNLIDLHVRAHDGANGAVRTGADQTD